MNAGDHVAAAERCAFVRDSFSWGAFFFAPLWLLRHRLWLAFLGWLAATILLWGTSYGLGLSSSATFWCYVAIAAFLGLEGAMLRSASLRRHGFDLADIVASESRDDAERIFYTRWLTGTAPQPPSAPLFRRVTPAAPKSERVIGVFPDAEA
jgi:hypothetical protein